MSEPTVQIPRQHLSICEHPRLERVAPRLLWIKERTQARRSRGAGGRRECGKSRVERQDSLQRCVLRQQAAPVHHVLHSAPHRRCHTPTRSWGFSVCNLDCEELLMRRFQFCTGPDGGRAATRLAARDDGLCAIVYGKPRATDFSTGIQCHSVQL